MIAISSDRFMWYFLFKYNVFSHFVQSNVYIHRVQPTPHI